MIDTNLIFTDKNKLTTGLAKKGYDVSKIDELETLIVSSREQKKQIEELRATRNAVQSDKNVSNDEKRALRDKILELETSLEPLTKKIDELLLDIPNTPDEDAPIGKDENDNKVIRECTDFYKGGTDKPVPHWEVGKTLKMLDIEMATKVSGSMFAFFRGRGSKLLRALVHYGLAINEDKYEEHTPPHMVTSKTLGFTGHLPKFADGQYEIPLDGLWMIPTAEVPLTGSFANTTFAAGELPKRVMGYSVSFRREAGSAGKDTRGLLRVHEFHKVEVLKVTEPQQKDKELAAMLEDCLQIIKDLKLKWRIVDLCTGDMGDKYGRCYDIEVWAPGVQKWLEVSSVGHFSDYQARRANIKYKTADGKTNVAYTLNGSGMATPRVFAAILETYQQKDGSIKVPDVLVPFMGCEFIK